MYSASLSPQRLLTRHPSGLLRGVLQCHLWGSPRVDVLRCTTPWRLRTSCRPRRSGNFQVDVAPVATWPGVCASAFSGARLPVFFERPASDNFGSPSTWRAGTATPAGVFDRMSRGARPPVVFECAAGLPAVWGRAAGARIPVLPFSIHYRAKNIWPFRRRRRPPSQPAVIASAVNDLH
jgi:hypothetical protein